jgi:hypothetical protein
MKELPKPPPDPAEELLKEWPELEAFGMDWVRKWLDLRERLIEIAKVMCRFPWMVECNKTKAHEHPPPLHGGGVCGEG